MINTQTKHMTYSERARHCHNPIAKHLLQLLDDKKTNLALSADVTSAQALLSIADLLGPEICILKTHIDIIDDFTPALTKQLQQLAEQHRFLIFEDRKFADIGHTVMQQYQGGIYKIADWAHIVNAHSLPGPGIIKGLQSGAKNKDRALLLLAEMSSAGHLLDERYQSQTLALAEQYPEFVIGFITQHKLSPQPHWINMTPGVKLETQGDHLGQQYITPEQAIKDHGSDIIIVGRGILAAREPLAEAQRYRQAAWRAYAGDSSLRSE